MKKEFIILIILLISVFFSGFYIGQNEKECTDCNVVKNIPDCNCECEQLECEQTDCVEEIYNKQKDVADMKKILEEE